MTQPAAVTDLIHERLEPFPRDHFLSSGDLNAATVPPLLDLADAFVDFNRQSSKSLDLMRGRTVMNLFFENSTRTSASFEIAAKRLGADVTALSPRTSSTAKGETLIDTAATLNAM
jgi:aspartate carbamoyltransferase catalytic subunit